jgi:hypothetical protein
LWLHAEFSDPGDEVIEKRGIAIFDTLAPAFATPLS